MAGQTTGVEEKLQAAEAALAAAMQHADLDDKTHDLIGEIAAIRATLALLRYQPETAINQARRALEYLHPDNLPFRSRAIWTLGFAHQLQGERAAARQVYTEAIRQAAGNIYYTVLATTSLGQVQESENQLYQAAETYRRSLQLLSDQGPPDASEEYIGLARIFYEWNNLDDAEQYGQQSLQLARQYDPAVDRFVICEVFLARVKLARGDVAEAVAILAEADQSVHQHNFVHRIPEVAAAQVITLLHQGDLAAAAHLAQMHELPLSQARVYLAQGDPSAALALLLAYRQQMEARGWQDERLKVMVLQAVALHAHGEKDRAVQLLGEALSLAEPGGFIRTFVDEGAPMAQLLCEAAARGMNRGYINKLLAAFEAENRKDEDKSYRPSTVLNQPLIEPLSQRELDVLRLIAQGLSNRQISERLFLALSTVKGHNRIIFDKLQVQSRTEAIARARELGLL
jgi:LuxR family maltose regulon positive regulatory protein